MAPGTRRANRGGYVEHDDFEGLPVRQWRQEWTNVAPPAQPELQQQNDIWAIELIHGMPKDAVLLPPHTQELLRAARSGRLYKRPAPSEEEEGDGDVVQPDKLDKKEDDVISHGYHLKTWRQIPKNVEAPVISHLAKRRKNTVTIASRTVEEKVQGPTVTRATVRRIDAAGNPYTEEVTLAEGQQPDGEIISTRVEALPAAKGTETLAPALPMARRRPPPPKRKSKAGPGRGKKKMARALAAGGGRPMPAATSGAGAPTVIKPEGENSANLPQIETLTPVHDSEMADGDEDDEEDDGDDVDDGEDGDEGEGEGDETVEIEHADQTTTDILATPTKELDSEMCGTSFIAEAEVKAEVTADAAPEDASTDLFATPTHPLTLAPHAAAPLEGSPLKNVVLQSPVEAPISLPPPVTAETATEDPDQSMQIPAADTSMDSLMAEPEPAPLDAGPAQQSEPVEQEPVAAEAEEAPSRSSNEEALLPPPPDQVGNISSPKTDDGAYKSSEDGTKSQAGHEAEEGDATAQPLTHLLSAINEDVIDPEDSVSVAAHRPRSTATSDIGGTSLDEMKDNPLSIAEEAPPEPEPEPALEPTSELAPTPESVPAPEPKPEPEAEVEAVLALALETKEATPPAAEEEPDLLGGLMSELDRQDGEAEAKQQTIQQESAQEESEQAAEPMDIEPPPAAETDQMEESEAPVNSEAEGGVQVEAKVEAEDEGQVETKAEPEPALEPQPEPEALHEAQPETTADPGDAPASDPEPAPLPAAESEETAAPDDKETGEEVTAKPDDEAPTQEEEEPADA